MKVLYIASNPADASEVGLVQEITELQRRVANVSGEPVTFIFLPAISFERLPLELHLHRPDVVHFSGHGDPAELVFANESGARVLVSAKMLCEFMKYENPPKLVYFNACDSAKLAKELTKVVPMAIGTTAPITNRAAWASAVVFYDRLLMGLSLENAFEAGNQMIQGLQQKSCRSALFHTPSVLPSSQRLHSVPRIVAWPESGKLDLDKDGLINLDVKLIGCPSNTFQVIFFTDDKRFVLDDPEYGESDAAFMAGQLCQLVRDTPRRGVIETDDVWPTQEEFRLFVCGTTSGGATFTVSSTMCTALKDYAAHVLRWAVDDTRREGLSRLIDQLSDPESAGDLEASTARGAAASATGKDTRLPKHAAPASSQAKPKSRSSPLKETSTAVKRSFMGPKATKMRGRQVKMALKK